MSANCYQGGKIPTDCIVFTSLSFLSPPSQYFIYDNFLIEATVEETFSLMVQQILVESTRTKDVFPCYFGGII